ncbi:MAG TPA: stage II sporulation protein M [Chitinophagaceae bacterium]|nr:stage II sporulation protein M [Chitinophagaceae bacterium]
MREALFIKKNKDRWERIQHQPADDADDMARDFIQLVDDLAYAKTFYPSGKVTQFVNGQASKIYLNIYKNRKEENNRLVTFWKYDLPLTVRKHHGIILFASILFLLFFIVGFFSAANDPGFVRDVLGNNYVNMTEENIARGNPLGVYQSGNPILSWLGIMINNISVSFRYFAMGLSFGILTALSLMKEAIRLGAFEYMFFSKGLGMQAALGVLIHGILELTAIIIACAAGLVMVKSFLFPGTIKRMDSLKLGVKDGVKIVIGLIPVFMIAAFFEGFVTRYYRMPIVLNLFILVAASAFIILYFIIYPVRLEKKLALQLNGEGV